MNEIDLKGRQQGKTDYLARQLYDFLLTADEKPIKVAIQHGGDTIIIEAKRLKADPKCKHTIEMDL